jgi:hypothetical protein
MRASRALIAAVVFAAAARHGGAQELPSGVDECLAKLDEQRYSAAQPEASEPRRLGNICPDLAASLDGGIWGPALIDGSSENLLPDEFRALVSLVRRYASQPQRRPISTAALDDAVAGVETDEVPPPLSLWEQAMQWLQAHLGSDEPESPGWLERWLKGVSLPERVTRYIVFAVAVLLVAATAAIVWNELRAVGAFGRSAVRRVRTGGLYASSEDSDAEPRTLGDVRRAPAARQPVLLLRLVVDRLKPRLRLTDSLTHRELVRASEASLTEAQVGSLRCVATAAERVTYGDWRPNEHDVEPILADGDALIGSLDDAPTVRS